MGPSRRPGLGWRLVGSVGLVWMLLVPSSDAAAVDGFQLTEITALPGSPGFGNFPDINDHGDVAFSADGQVYLYVRSTQQLVNISALPGAPAKGFNDAILIIVGLVAYAVFALWAHAEWIGVAPFG